jgi:hypothetical protein
VHSSLAGGQGITGDHCSAAFQVEADVADRVSRGEDDSYDAGHVEAAAVLKPLVNGRRLEALDHRAQLGAPGQHVRRGEPGPLGAIDEWHLNLVRQHTRASGLHKAVQRADVVDVLVGEDDALQVLYLHARLSERSGDLVQLPWKPGVHQCVAVG